MLRELLKLGELGDFGIGTEKLFANDELRVAIRISAYDFSDDFANRVIGMSSSFPFCVRSMPILHLGWKSM